MLLRAVLIHMEYEICAWREAQRCDASVREVYETSATGDDGVPLLG
jgi:hypothetical protein